jgi:hypothetical protein
MYFKFNCCVVFLSLKGFVLLLMDMICVHFFSAVVFSDGP